MNQACELPRCAHCGLPLTPANTVVSKQADGASALYCCHGCAGAASLIHDLGLDDYYRFREDNSPAPALDLSDTELQVFAIAELVAPFLQQRGDQVRLRLLIEGIHCAACIWLLEKVLSTLPGVSQVTVNLATNEMHVSWHGDQVSPLTLARKIVELGYRPRLPGVGDHRGEILAQRWMLARLLVAGLGAMQAMMYAVALYAGAFDGIEPVYRDFFRIAGLLVSTPVVFFSGWPFLSGAWRLLRHGQVNMDVPVALALVLGWGGSVWATLTGGAHVYFESISMFVFFLLGSRWLEQRQRLKVSGLFGRLQADLPALVRRLDDTGETLVPSRLVNVGDHLQLASGDVVPVDGVICNGHALVGEAAVSGESVPVERCEGARLVAGSRVLEGVVTLQAETTVDSSHLALVGDMIHRAQQQRLLQHLHPARVAAWFVAAVLGLAALTFAIHLGAGLTPAFEHALAVLVISCPCALALAAPLTSAAMLGRALRDRVLIADPQRFLTLPRQQHWLFDKTGTLTRGDFQLTDVEQLAPEFERTLLLGIVAGLERHARHPLARALQSLATPVAMTAVHLERTGVAGHYDGINWRIRSQAGNADSPVLQVVLSANDRPVLRLSLADSAREEGAAVLASLRALGRMPTVSSGDQAGPVQALAAQLEIEDARAAQTPADKVARVAALHSQGGVVFVGDGVNDAEAMLAADVAVAVAGSSALTRDAAHLYLLEPGLSALPGLIGLARSARRVLLQNLFWALGYNLVAIPFAMAGLVPPWMAALGMSASSLVVTLNAARLTRWKS